MLEATALLWILATACGGNPVTPLDSSAVDATPDALTGTPHLTVELSRPPGTTQIAVAIHAIDADGAPSTGHGAVDLETPDGSRSVTEAPPGTYAITLTPASASGEYPLSASLAGFTSVSVTPLVFPAIDDTWDLAERVPGAVNTPGWEDSAEISPDGEWLLLEYTPIDLVCCAVGGAPCGGVAAGDPASARCEDSLGPYSAPDRPGLPGAARITSPTHIVDACANVGLTSQQAFVIPPVGLYGFHRQPDGSFGEPFPITFTGDDGCLTPFGPSFIGPPNGTTAQLVFAWDDPRDYGSPTDTGNDVYTMQITLGAPVSLGELEYAAGAIQTISFAPQRLALADLSGGQGNPHFGAPWLWFDDEGLSEHDLYAARASGPLPGGPFAPVQTIAISQPGRGEIQPFADGTRLFYTVNTSSIMSADLTGSDPSVLASWGPERIDLRAEGGVRTGAIAAMGEPSVMHAGGETWLYFVYVIKTATGLDANVGRLRAR